MRSGPYGEPEVAWFRVEAASRAARSGQRRREASGWQAGGSDGISRWFCVGAASRAARSRPARP